MIPQKLFLLMAMMMAMLESKKKLLKMDDVDR
jgi:hypothetical protein